MCIALPVVHIPADYNRDNKTSYLALRLRLNIILTGNVVFGMIMVTIHVTSLGH